MDQTRPMQAVIFDMDGVLTRTARLHERAWKTTFDRFLEPLGDQRPFSRADYRAHVDGKPRYRGVQDFLRSRRLELPYGEPSDKPGEDTLCALGNRKNELLQQLLEQGGVQVFDDAVAALARWRRGGLKVAAISSSRNCRRILRAAELDSRFDVILGGEAAERAGLRGKREILVEAARQLGVEPGEAVVLEDATAGVRAAVEANFGCVVGVSRSGNDSDLEEAGAHFVVDDVYRTRFARRLPQALERLAEVSAWRGERPLAVFVDFDGTLAPIVDDPDQACISDATRAALAALRCPVAVISGRDRQDVEARVELDGLYYAGNHGFDIAGHGHESTQPEAEKAVADVDRAEAQLERQLEGREGVVIERKRYSVAVHSRRVVDPRVREEVQAAADAASQATGLRLRRGKEVLELEPAVDWDKGRALRWLVDLLPVAGGGTPFVVYLGDDETDEDAFAALGEQGAGIRVADGLTDSLADYQVSGPDEVLEVLQHLATV